MNTNSIMSQLSATVHELMPALHGHQHKAITALCYGMALAKHCHLSRAALPVPGFAQPQSTERRFRRLVANERVATLGCALAMGRCLLLRWQGRRLVLLLDETPLHNALRVLKVSLCYQGRALRWCGTAMRPMLCLPRSPVWPSDCWRACAAVCRGGVKLCYWGIVVCVGRA